MKFKNKVSIVDAKRLPIGKVNGILRTATPEDLYATLIAKQFEKVESLKLADIEQVFLGNVMNLGGNIARRCALAAQIAPEIPAQTIDCQCASGLAAIISGADSILAGNVETVLAGGIESNSNANLIIDRVTKKQKFRYPMTAGDFPDRDVGFLTDKLAANFGLKRSEVDKYAFESQRKAYVAFSKGMLKNELIPYKGLTKDECPRFDTNMERLGQLSTVFTDSGICTAGNSCPINDGASSVILRKFRKNDEAAGYLLGSQLVGCRPEKFILGPIYATRKLLHKFNLDLEQIDAFEMNEAFAAQALICQRKLKIPKEKLNKLGGAIAYGHPYGATGGILVTHLLNVLNRLQRPALGIATLCVAGGMGASILVGNAYWGQEDD
ncbi:thiolase family protein [Liquorilactobacillus uvarum]|uniref:thiolase family protein n=1 Tax=Liquorilactobacillus uvarum TaxID=303240 RepID=UPI00288A64EF|nr:thiolase family protein [Liquorilactobacillus uvarum]